MSRIVIRSATKKDLEDVAALVLSRNSARDHRCIHSDTGDTADEVLQELERIHRNQELRMAVAYDGDRCMGFLGSELDVEGGRGWLRGPVIAASDPVWGEIAPALWGEFLSRVPAAIRRVDAFLDVANVQGRDFYLSQGFERIRLIHAYTCPRTGSDPEPHLPIETLSRTNEKEFAVLHNALFPGTVDGSRILAGLDDDHRVFVRTRGDELLGYLYATVEEGDEEGTVEFLGVREDARGQGIGLALLHAARRWFFGEKPISGIGLVVNEELANAQALYERAGFTLRYTGLNLRREWEARERDGSGAPPRV